jgi:hypothetical protein
MEESDWLIINHEIDGNNITKDNFISNKLIYPFIDDSYIDHDKLFYLNYKYRFNQIYVPFQNKQSSLHKNSSLIKSNILAMLANISKYL